MRWSWCRTSHVTVVLCVSQSSIYWFVKRWSKLVKTLPVLSRHLVYWCVTSWSNWKNRLPELLKLCVQKGATMCHIYVFKLVKTPPRGCLVNTNVPPQDLDQWTWLICCPVRCSEGVWANCGMWRKLMSSKPQIGRLPPGSHRFTVVTLKDTCLNPSNVIKEKTRTSCWAIGNNNHYLSKTKEMLQS